MSTIQWEDFQRVDMRCGTVVAAEPFPEARNPAYKILVDFGGDTGILKTSAQVTDLYSTQELVGKQVIGVTNFPARQIGPIRSEFLLVGFQRDDGAVVLAVPDQSAPNGSRLV